MPGHDTESQFKFLIACIKHSSSGKVDFTKVAEELEIVSKGAAAKRYERLMKAHGIAGASSARNGGTPAPSGSGGTGSSRKAPGSAKKRKIAPASNDTDDAEYVKVEPKREEIKSEVEDYTPSDGSYMINPGHTSDPSTAAAAAALPALATMPGGTPAGEDDEVYLICASDKADASSDPSATCSHHAAHPMVRYPSVVDHSHPDRAPQPALANVGPPASHDCGANYPSQTSDHGLTTTMHGGSWFNPPRLGFFLE